MKISPLILTPAALVVSLAVSGDAHGHAIGVEAKLQDGEVRIEAFFDDDTPAVSVRVSVKSAGGAEVATGRTDDDGRWSFPAPSPGRYEVVVDGGDGHRARTRITIPGAEPAGSEAERISDGPSRAEFTTIPWQRVALGLGFFALLGLIGWAARRPASPAD